VIANCEFDKVEIDRRCARGGEMLCKDGSVCRYNSRRGCGVVGGRRGRRGVVVEVVDGRRKLEDEVGDFI
jgi:hypothetical protein